MMARQFIGSQVAANSTSACSGWTIVGLTASWLILYVLAVTEYGAGVLVVPPGASILSVFVVNEAHYGQGDYLAGLFVLLLGVVLAPLALLGLWRGGARLAGRIA